VRREAGHRISLNPFSASLALCPGFETYTPTGTLGLDGPGKGGEIGRRDSIKDPTAEDPAWPGIRIVNSGVVV